MAPRPGDIDYELYQMLQKFKGQKSIFTTILFLILIVLAAFSSFYTVQPDEEAVVIRFGKYIDTTQPGLHFKLPLGIDQVTKVKTKIVHQTEFGFRTRDLTSRRTSYTTNNLQEESLMLTGDLNVAEVEWVVQYQISDPFKYLFKTSDPIRNVRDVSESIMRRVVGDKMVTDVLTTGRVGIASEAKILMQEILNKYDLGILIKSIKLQDVNPPKVVQPSFNDVNAAKQEQEKMINQAEEAYNKVIPEAKGKAKKLISEAEGYAEALINRAEGDAEKFQAVYREYRKAPSITRKRIFLETMQSIFKNMDNLTIIDSKVKGLLPVYGQGVINAK
jgi:membrane protease subunit HflK